MPEFGMTRKRTPGPNRIKKSEEPISFRPEQEIYDLLEQRAQTLGTSVGEVACHYVTKMVRGDGLEEISPAVVARLIAELREDLAVSVEHLLASAGRVKSDDASKWVDENLRT